MGVIAVTMEYIGVSLLIVLLLCLWELEQIRKNANSIRHMIFTDWSEHHANIELD
jgi:hypothetical protein